MKSLVRGVASLIAKHIALRLSSVVGEVMGIEDRRVSSEAEPHCRQFSAR